MRILIAICSACALADRRAACRDTWVQDIKDLAPNVSYKFFVGVPSREEDKEIKLEEDVVQLQCNDDYRHLPEKIHRMLEWIDANCEYDYAFKCDDDTYVVPSRLENLLENRDDYVGDPMGGIAAYGGAGYFLSKYAVGKILSDDTIWRDHGLEDLHVGELCNHHGIKIVKGEGLYGGTYPVPAVNNTVVTNHKVIPHAFYWRWQAFSAGVAATGRIIISSRKDETSFFNNGIFCIRGVTEGSWRYNKDTRTLHLAYNTRERYFNDAFVRKDDCTFELGDKTLVFEENPDAWLVK